MAKNNNRQKQELSKSKYELTLSEFPLFMLAKKTDKSIKAITYEDTIIGRDNELVKREWRVLPDAETGFGSASTFETMFDLFQVWKEQGFDGPYINFGTVYHLLKRKGQSTGKQQYRQVIKDLNCLVGVRVIAKNAFWDNERKAYVDMTFHLFDRLDLYKEKPTGQAALPFGRIKASEVLFGSIRKNSLLTADFDSEFFHSLTPMEQRLAIYLSKIFRSQAVHKRELSEFARQIPINAKLQKHVKERVKKACQGLLAKGFKPLASCTFEKGADGQTELIVFRRKGGATEEKGLVRFSGAKRAQTANKEYYEIDLLAEDILAVCQDDQSLPFYKKVARLIPREDIYRAIAEVKEIRDLGEVRTNKGAIFTSLIKKYAVEQGIEL